MNNPNIAHAINDDSAQSVEMSPNITLEVVQQLLGSNLALANKFLNTYLVHNKDKECTLEEISEISTILHKLTSSLIQLKKQEIKDTEQQLNPNANSTKIHSNTLPPLTLISPPSPPQPIKQFQNYKHLSKKNKKSKR